MGSLSVMTSTDNITWTGVFTPWVDIEDANNTLILSGEYSDVAGNAGVSARSNRYDIDTKTPVVSSFTIADGSMGAGESASVTLVFSEAVRGFLSEADITALNGSLSVMTSTDNITWTGVFTPWVDIEDANNTLILSGEYSDVAGNAGVYAYSVSLSASLRSVPTSVPSFVTIAPSTFLSSIPTSLPSSCPSASLPSIQPSSQPSSQSLENSIQVIVVEQTDVSQSILYVAMIIAGLAILSSLATLTFFARMKWRKVEPAPSDNVNGLEGGLTFDDAFTAREGVGANGNQAALVQVETRRSSFMGRAFGATKDVMSGLKSKVTIQPSTLDSNENGNALHVELAHMTALYEESQQELKRLRVGESTIEDGLSVPSHYKHTDGHEKDGSEWRTLKPRLPRASLRLGPLHVDDASDDDSDSLSDDDSLSDVDSSDSDDSSVYEIQVSARENDVEKESLPTRNRKISGAGGKASSPMKTNALHVDGGGNKNEKQKYDRGEDKHEKEHEMEHEHKIKHEKELVEEHEHKHNHDRKHEIKHEHEHKDGDKASKNKTTKITSEEPHSSNGSHSGDGAKDGNDQYENEKKKKVDQTPSKRVTEITTDQRLLLDHLMGTNKH